MTYSVMKFQLAIDMACQEPTLVDALAFIALYECERVIPIAHEALNGRGPECTLGPSWDTCFKYLIKEVMEHYAIKKLKGE